MIVSRRSSAALTNHEIAFETFTVGKRLNTVRAWKYPGPVDNKNSRSSRQQKLFPLPKQFFPSTDMITELLQQLWTLNHN